jgi:hypothetical protein
MLNLHTKVVSFCSRFNRAATNPAGKPAPKITAVHFTVQVRNNCLATRALPRDAIMPQKPPRGTIVSCQTFVIGCQAIEHVYRLRQKIHVY